MADLNINGSTRVVPAIVRTARPVALKIQQEIKSAVHQGLIKRLDLEKIALMHENPASQQQLLAVIHQLIGEQNIPLSAAERDRLAQEVLDEVFGLGPLEPLLQDPTVNDILVNTYNSVYVERRGVLEKTAVVFKDDRHLMHVIDKIVSAVGRRVDESSPMVDARLKDGSRVNVDYSAAGRRRPDSVYPQVWGEAAGRRGPVAQQGAHRADARNPEGRGAGPAQHHRLRRHRRGQNYFAERAVRLYRRARAHRHH